MKEACITRTLSETAIVYSPRANLRRAAARATNPRDRLELFAATTSFSLLKRVVNYRLCISFLDLDRDQRAEYANKTLI